MSRGVYKHKPHQGFQKDNQHGGTNYSLQGFQKGNQLGKANAGSNHSRWNPDRKYIRENNIQRNNGEYKIWAKTIKNRDGWKCRMTNKDCDGKVVAHHILSWAKFPELRYEVNNGITLCHFHHPRKRNDEIKLSPYFQKLVMATVN